MLSIGDYVDKLVIELIKAHNLREKLQKEKDEKTKTEINEKLTIANSNRSIIKQYLDSKIEKVHNGEKNRSIEHFRTY